MQGHLIPERYPIVNLNGHRIVLDSGGLTVNQGTHLGLFTGGSITSSSPILETRLLSQTDRPAYIEIQSVIADSNQKVGLRVTGNNPGEGALYLTGNSSNTFTGDAEVSGRRNHLVLKKGRGAIAIRGNILAKDRGILRFESSGQVLKTATVTLRNYGVLQMLNYEDTGILFKSLSVDSGGVIQFTHDHPNTPPNLSAKYYIYLDELIIIEGKLSIEDWDDGRDFLLVRKSSQHLANALRKMKFTGYDPRNIHLEDYDKDYWQISALPEPATYGAILGVVGLGLCTYRRYRNKKITRTLR